MHILQMGQSKQPTKLEVLEILAKRSFYPNPKEIGELQRLRAGREGEKVLVDYLQKYGKAHWTFIQNIWLDYFGTLECDGVLLTNTDLYILEIKNYSGLYAYENGISKLNHRQLSANPIYQTRKATMKVRELINSRFPHIKVHGVLVFVGIDSQIIIKSEIEDIHILQRHELRTFIEKIVAAENTSSNQILPIDRVLKYLESYTTENPYPVEPLSSDILSGLQKGILCMNCGNPQVEVTKKFVKCRCGATELREKATVRTICEYGVLNFTTPLTVKALVNFFGNQNSELYIRKILNTHFDLVSSGRNATYQNYTKQLSAFFDKSSLKG